MKSTSPIILLVLISSASGCSLLGYEKNEINTMHVDSLVAPDEIAADQAFSIRIVGLLTNGCQRFERLDVNKTPNQLELRMLAREQVRYDELCTDDIRWVSQEYTVEPPFADTVDIVAHQRHGGVVRQTVRVK